MRNSLATGERHANKQAITFLDGLTVKKLYRDTSLPESPVKVDSLMELDLQPYPYTWADDAFVFDGMVAARVNSTAFSFFLYPLVESQSVVPLPIRGPSFGREEESDSSDSSGEDEIEEDGDSAEDGARNLQEGDGSDEPQVDEEEEEQVEDPTEDIDEPVEEDTRVDIDATLADNSGEFYVLNFDFSTLIDYGFAPNHHERTYTLFGVAGSELVKVVYAFDDEDIAITEKVQVIRNTSFNGRFMRIKVTDNFLVVSNSEGEAPGITFFDHDWDLIHYFPRFPLPEAPYNLAVYEDPDLEML